MADRNIAAGDTLNKFRFEFNGTAEDIGDISVLQGTSGIIAAATDVVEAVVLLNPDLTTISTDNHVFSGGSIIFEGVTEDSFETTLAVTDPTADRTFTLPNHDGTVLLIDATQTITNHTLTTPTINSPVLNTAVSGTAVKDEDNMSSNSATVLATQQSIKAYIDNQTVTFAITSNVLTKTGTQTLTNKTFTSPTIDSFTLGSSTISGLGIGANGIIIEGATADAHEVTLNAQDPTQDNVITIPNSTMTAITNAQFATKGSHFAKVLALG